MKVGEDTPDWQSVSNIHNGNNAKSYYDHHQDNNANYDDHDNIANHANDDMTFEDTLEWQRVSLIFMVTKGFVSLRCWHQKWLFYGDCHQDCDDNSNDCLILDNRMAWMFLKFSKTIHLMWHSKGNRVTLQSLVTLASREKAIQGSLAKTFSKNFSSIAL